MQIIGWVTLIVTSIGIVGLFLHWHSTSRPKYTPDRNICNKTEGGYIHIIHGPHGCRKMYYANISSRKSFVWITERKIEKLEKGAKA